MYISQYIATLVHLVYTLLGPFVHLYVHAVIIELFSHVTAVWGVVISMISTVG